MPLSLQSKLLRVLQERKVTPGGSKDVEVDVRVVATTKGYGFWNQKRDFREDLYYRLNVFPLRTLALKIDLMIFSIISALIQKHIGKDQSLPF